MGVFRGADRAEDGDPTAIDRLTPGPLIERNVE